MGRETADAEQSEGRVGWCRRLQQWCLVFDRRSEEVLDNVRRRRGVPCVAWTASRLGDVGAVSVVGWWLVLSPRRGVLTGAAIGFQAIALNYGVKRVFERQRPSGPAHTSSLPSGHVATAVAAATLAPASAAPVVSAAAAACAAGRVVGQDHWVSDTVAGAVAGLAFGHAARALLRRIAPVGK